MATEDVGNVCSVLREDKAQVQAPAAGSALTPQAVSPGQYQELTSLAQH